MLFSALRIHFRTRNVRQNLRRRRRAFFCVQFNWPAVCKSLTWDGIANSVGQKNLSQNLVVPLWQQQQSPTPWTYSHLWISQMRRREYNIILHGNSSFHPVLQFSVPSWDGHGTLLRIGNTLSTSFLIFFFLFCHHCQQHATVDRFIMDPMERWIFNLPSLLIMRCLLWWLKATCEWLP